MKPGARAEWDTLRHVLVHEPGVEVFFALLAPEANLYERFFNHHEARWEHRELCRILHDNFGVRVHHLKTALMEKAAGPGPIRDALVSFAGRRLQDGGGDSRLPLTERDPEHLFRIAVLNPAISRGKGAHVRLVSPLHNLYFMPAFTLILFVYT